MVKRFKEWLAKIPRKLKRVKIHPWFFYWLIAGIIGFALLAWLYHWGIHVSQDWVTLQQNPTDATKKKFDASLEIAKAIVGGIGTIATIVGGAAVFWNIRLTQTRLITERFSKAVEQLGSDKIEVRLGGIYALERIAQDSDRDHWTIMEVLTSFIREKSPIPRIPKEEIRAKAYEIWQKSGRRRTDEENWQLAITALTAARVTKDIHAALTVIGRRDKKDPPGKCLDLSNANLRGADLRDANLIFAKLSYADLSEAELLNANLRGAKNLTVEQLEGAKLCQTKLPEGINLDPNRDCQELFGIPEENEY